MERKNNYEGYRFVFRDGPLIVLAVSLLLTCSAAYYLAAANKARDQVRFQSLVAKTESSIRNRIEMYIAILRSTAGLADAVDTLNRREFKAFVERLDVQHNYPGIQGIGYSRLVSARDVPAYVARLRSEGVPISDVKPKMPKRDEYHIIAYLEPLDRRNLAAIGYDMSTESTRRSAMEFARDSGLPAMTGKITLVQEIDQKKQAGFLILVPIYRQGWPTETIQQRRAALVGFTYSPFRTDDLMAGILIGGSSEIAFKIYNGYRESAETLLHDSSSQLPNNEGRPMFISKHNIEVASQPWLIVYSTRPEFDAGSSRIHVWYLLLAGLVCSLALFAVAVAQSRARQAAERAAEETRKSEEALRETEKLKSQFLANVSHELRTPLTLMLGPIESLLAGEYGPIPERRRRVMKTIHNNATRLLQLIGGLLDFSKLDAGKLFNNPEPTPVGELTRNISDDFAPAMKAKGIEFKTESRPTAVVDLDRYLYERILFNLLSNALKFTASGGSISVKAKATDGRLRVSVTDTGVGIAESELPKLFRRFRQVEGSSTRQFEGTGLGLALVKEFAELMGGSVAVESTVGKGSVFTLDCPAPASTGLPAPIGATKAKSVRIQKYASGEENSNSVLSAKDDASLPKVLIAEDNRELAEYVSSLLKDICQIQIARDGDEALAVARKWKPNIVLSDVMMPKRDGLSLCREVKADPETAKIPFLLLTALTDRDSLMKGWEAGADEYLSKPFYPKVLVTRVRTLLEKARLSAEIEAITVRSQKMAAVGQLAAGVAHEINNPLGIILGFAQSAAKRVHGSDPLALSVRSIEREALRCKNLVQNLLMFSRQAKGGCIDFDLDETVSATMGMIEAQAKVKGVEIRTELGNIHAISGDRNQIQQVIVNLCSNALDAVSSGGQVIVRTRFEERHECALIEVADTGCGIPEEIRDKIFNPFFTTKEVGKGTGLGLSLVHEIVQKHKGSIEVDSEVGRGTTIRVFLPMPKRSPERLAEQAVGAGGGGLKHDGETAEILALRPTWGHGYIDDQS